MTYSIVARDAESKALGIAVQTAFFAVGRVCPWAEPGVAAVATQSFVEPSYGPLGLDLMRAGHAADAALRALLAADDGREVRQVAFVDASGRVAAHTGDNCVHACGHVTGDGFSAQANMMERDTVPDAMAAAFADADGPLPRRLLAAMEAAEAEGGDIRGRQSAAMVVVGGERSQRPWDRLVDLRVDEHTDPVAELGRLLTYRDAYTAFSGRGSDDAATALASARALAPEDAQLTFWHAMELARAGQIDEAAAAMAEAVAANPRWSAFLDRLAAAGHLDLDPATLEQLRNL